MDQELETHHEKVMAPVKAGTRNVADGLPALELSAAVMGVVGHTMEKVGRAPCRAGAN